MLYITLAKSPFPFVCKIIFPEFINLIAISGWINAILVTTSSIYPDSVKSFFKNLYLTGVLKNKFLTVIVVPLEQPISSKDKTSPPSTTILFPISSSSVLLTSSTFAIAAILANASPLNPIDFTVSKSSAVLILLVA